MLKKPDVQKPPGSLSLTLEAWSQGLMFGSLLVMAAITVVNMRRKITLHKLILVELIFGMFHGTFIFANPPYYGWYLSVTAIFLNTSWTLHNVIAWMKNKPFLSRRVSMIYICTVISVQPYWVLEIAANWMYFNNFNDLFVYTRPYEAIFRDPWWIFTCVNLFYNIQKRYSFSVMELVRFSPRLGILLASMILSICFIIIDILAVTNVINPDGSPNGINPFWKLAYIFKCLTDTVVLDDFKTALDRLQERNLKRLGREGAHTSTTGDRDPMSITRTQTVTNTVSDNPGKFSFRKSTNKGKADDYDIEAIEICRVREATHQRDRSESSAPDSW